MDLGLTDRRVLVTGGSKGIGLACAAAFLAEGAAVAICSRSADNIAAAVARHPALRGFVADCSDAADAARLVEAVETGFGPLDILVNSAGAARRSPAEALTPGHWRDAMDAKFFSTIYVLDPVIKRMAERGRGVVVNVIGTGGKVPSLLILAISSFTRGSTLPVCSWRPCTTIAATMSSAWSRPAMPRRGT